MRESDLTVNVLVWVTNIFSVAKTGNYWVLEESFSQVITNDVILKFVRVGVLLKDFVVKVVVVSQYTLLLMTGPLVCGPTITSKTMINQRTGTRIPTVYFMSCGQFKFKV